MRAALAVSILLLSVAGCAMAPPAEGPSASYHSLRAFINPPTSAGPAFYLSRPAYVAMFEVSPGRGASLVYPSPGHGRMDGFTFAGSQSFFWGSQRQRYNRDTYLPAYGLAGSGPRYYLLIASERPLDLDQFGTFGMGMRSTLGLHFASANAYNTMERIAQLTLPSAVDDGSWASDVYVHWPEALYSSPGRGRVLLSCNGYQAYVALQYLALAERQLCGERYKESPQERGDSTIAPRGGEPVKPGRRTPVPQAEQKASLRERVTSSVQLEEARRRQVLQELERRERFRREIGASSGVHGPRERPDLTPTRSGAPKPAPRASGSPARSGSSSTNGAATRARPAPSGSTEARPARPRPSSGGSRSGSEPARRPSSGGGSGEG